MASDKEHNIGDHTDAESLNENVSEQSSSEDEDKAFENEINIHERLQSVVEAIKTETSDLESPKARFGEASTLSPQLTWQSETTKECILHFLFKDQQIKRGEKERMAQAIRHITHYHPQLLTLHSESKQTALYVALENMNKSRAYLILHGLLKKEKEPKLKKEDIAKAIEKPCGSDRENCLHRAMRLSSRVVDHGILERLIGFATPQAMNAKDSSGATPLHRAVHYELSSPKMLGIIRKLLERAERKPSKSASETSVMDYAFDAMYNDGRELLSIYEYHMKTREEVLQKQREAPFTKAKDTTSKPVKKSTDTSASLQVATSIQVGGKGIEDQKAGRNKEKKDDEPKMGIQRTNTAKMNDSRRMAPEKPTEDDNTTQDAERQQREECSLAIRNELKLHCLRTRLIPQAKRFLYGPKKHDTQLYFDYVGLVNEDVNPSIFFDNFKVTKFDEILQYVEFPAITLRKERKISDHCRFFRGYEDIYRSNTVGRKDLLFFFAWLKEEKKVKQIIKVIVDDFKDPHSDDVIEKCLSLFTIDVLNWSKPDLDPEMLCNACPDVQELHLQWGGNNAILRAWSEPEGLPRLEKLKKVTIHYSQVSERVKQQVQRFEERMARVLSQRSASPDANLEGLDDISQAAGRPGIRVATPTGEEITVSSATKKKRTYERVGNRKVKIETIEGSQMHGEGAEKTGMSMKRLDGASHKWLDSIDDFAAALRDLVSRNDRYKFKGDEVKVALIDDGIKLDEKAFRGENIIPGTSFGYYSSDKREKQWYVSDTGHGTTMAHMILRVCPMAKIYPIKLDTSSDIRDGNLRIQPESTIKAIEEATRNKVNIISMSWTVNQLNDDMKNKLNAALSEATKEGILMFCSSADDGQFSSEQIYPAAHGRDKLFRIGAAEPDGTPYSWVPLEAVDYIFPGVDVAQAKKRDIPLWKVEDVKVTGSSISTALAAGLAALVIWFIKAGVEYTSSNRGSEMHDGRGDGLDLRDLKAVQSFKGMQYAFKQLGADQSPSKKYVEIWSSLDERSRKLQGLRDSPEVALKEICHLARNLVTK